MKTSYTAYYRTGGTENFQWRKCAPVATKDEVTKQVADITKMGYKALYAPTDLLNAIGLPDTYEYKPA